MITAAAIAMLLVTLAFCVLLLGRFTLMVIGAGLVVSGLVVLQRDYLEGWQGVAILCLALVLLMAGRPSWLRRGHRARTTRQEA